LRKGVLSQPRAHREGTDHDSDESPRVQVDSTGGTRGRLGSDAVRVCFYAKHAAAGSSLAGRAYLSREVSYRPPRAGGARWQVLVPLDQFTG